LTWLVPPAAGPADRRALWLAAAGFAPLIQALRQGQLSPIALLAVSGALVSLRREREPAAGLWLLLGMFKPTLLIGPLLALLALRRWGALAIFAAGALTVIAGSLVVAGNWLPAFERCLSTYRMGTAGDWQFGAAMWNAYGLLITLLGAGPLTDAIALALSALTWVAILVICWPRPAGQHPGWEVRFAVAILLSLLSNPHLYAHDMALALVPGLILWPVAQHSGWRCRLLAAGLAAGPVVSLAALAVNTQLGTWYFVGLLLLIAAAWSQLEPSARPEPSGPGH